MRGIRRRQQPFTDLEVTAGRDGQEKRRML